MRKLRRVLAVLMAFLTVIMGFTITSFAEGGSKNIEIGSDSTEYSRYVPDYALYNYSVTQQIYTADELMNTSGTITELAFYCSDVPTKYRNFEIYLADVDKNSFSSNADWVPYSAMTKCYDGTYTYTAEAWNTITLTTPFVHDGSKNLLVCVYNKNGSWSSSDGFKVYKTSVNSTLYTYRDDSGYSELPDSGTLVSYKNALRLKFEGLHEHNFTYSASGATITATCTAEGCDLEGNSISFTMVRPPMQMEGDGQSPEVDFEGLDAFNEATGLNLSLADVSYYDSDGYEYEYAPNFAGDFTATITVAEGVTASVDYSIATSDLGLAIELAIGYYQTIPEGHPEIENPLRSAILKAMTVYFDDPTPEEASAALIELLAALDNARAAVAALNVDDDAWLNPLRTKLAIAAEVGGVQTVEYESDFALPYEIMKYLEDHPQITLVYHIVAEDKGIDTTVKIPGSAVKADPNIPWYGPLYLQQNFPNK